VTAGAINGAGEGKPKRECVNGIISCEEHRLQDTGGE